MAILTPAPSETAYALTGSTTGPFATQWAFSAPEEVRAYLELGGVRAADLTRGADFTVTGGNPMVDGGSVSLDIGHVPPNGWAAGDRIVLYRLTLARQPLALPDTEGHKPRATEQALDRLTRGHQENLDKQARSLFLPVGEAAFELEPAGQRAGKPAGFDADGRMIAVEGYLPNAALVGAVGARVVSRADAASARGDLQLGSASTRNVGTGAGQVAPAEALDGLASDADVQALAADMAELQVSGTALKAVATVAALVGISTPLNNDRVEVRADPLGDVTNGNGVWRYNAGTTAWVWLGPLIPASLTDAVEAVGDRVDGLHPTAGELLNSDTLALGAASNGAGLIDVSPYVRGWSIPNGQTGEGTFVLPRFLVSEAVSRSWIGLTVHLTVMAAASVGYLTHQDMFDQGVNIVDRDGSPRSNQGERVQHGQSGNRIVSVYALTWTGDERMLQPILMTFNGDASGLQTFRVTGMSLAPASAVPGAQTSSDLALRAEKDRLAADAMAPLPVQPGQVMTCGAGQTFNTLTDLQAVATNASASWRTRAEIRGVLTEKNVFRKPYVDLVGRSPELDGIRVINPPNADLADIEMDTALWDNDAGYIGYLRFEVEGARYAGHSDPSDGYRDLNGIPAHPDRRNHRQVHEFVEWIHHGNAKQKAWQAANGGNPDAVWIVCNAFGAGASSGQHLTQRYCLYHAPFVAWSMHDNIDFERPATCIDIGGRYNSTELGRCVGLQGIGSGLVSLCIRIGCTFNGDLHIDAGRSLDPNQGGLWRPYALAKQPSDMNGWHLTGYGNTPAVFTISHHARALKIESASTNYSTVSVSGSAAAVIFGEVVEKPGAGGLKGYCYGRADISGMAVGPDLQGNSDPTGVSQLGKRLGDCSSISKTLNVVVDGGAPIVVTFNANHTAQSNATVLGIINAALGAAATASAYDVGGRYRPSFTDEEMTLINTSATGIPMGSVLAYDATQPRPHACVRLMTAADPASLFAGVAWEDLYPGGAGRVKTRGWLILTDVLRDDAAYVPFGQTFSISATQPGRVVVGGTQGLLRAIRPGGDGAAVEVRP